MKNLVRALRAMADEPRMTILSVLSIRGAVCVSHLQEAMKTPQPTVSRYLSILRNAGLLESERRGQWVYYSLSHDDSSLVMEMIQRASDQLKDTVKIKRIMERLDKLEQQPPLTDEAVPLKAKAKAKGVKRALRKRDKQVLGEEAPVVGVTEALDSEAAAVQVAAELAESVALEGPAQLKASTAEPPSQQEETEAGKSDEAGNVADSPEKRPARKKKQQLPSLFDFQ